MAIRETNNTSTEPQPSDHHRHHLTKAERDHLGGWNGLVWLDYLNADCGAAFEIWEAEREEIEGYEQQEREAEQQRLNGGSRSKTPKASPKTTGATTTNLESKPKPKSNRADQDSQETLWRDWATYPIGPIMGE